MRGTSRSDEFRLRIFSTDYYSRSPIPELDVITSEFRGSEIKQVPILRIFGTTPEGVKTCLHVHGVFPYLYIPCEESSPEPKLSYQIANSIDKALNISLKQNNSTTQHVYKVIVVKGLPFYGYHYRNHQFYKVFFYNPVFVKRVTELLLSGAIMGVSYQPHEAHINFIMQFFIDFNLYGMSFINLESVKFRKRGNQTSSSQLFNSASDDSYSYISVQHTSVCEYEADCFAQHISNRKELLYGNIGINPGLEALWSDEERRHNELNLSGDIKLTQSQIRDNVPTTESHDYHKRKLVTRLALYADVLSGNSFNTENTLSMLDESDLQVESSGFNKTVYPAETPDSNEYLNATKVILHQTISSSEESIKLHKLEDYLVNEEVISQLTQKSNSTSPELDSEDLNFIEMLKDMEDKVENDSILGSQHINDNSGEVVDNVHENFDKNNENINANVKIDDCRENSDDFSLTQYFNQENFPETIDWQDSYWEDVDNISQLDGSWDEVKKKSKKRLRVGLSKPPKKKKLDDTNKVDLKKSIDIKFQANSPKRTPKKSPSKFPRNYEPLNIKIETSPSIFKNSSPCEEGKKFESSKALTTFKKLSPKKLYFENNVLNTTCSKRLIVKLTKLDDTFLNKNQKSPSLDTCEYLNNENKMLNTTCSKKLVVKLTRLDNTFINKYQKSLSLDTCEYFNNDNEMNASRGESSLDLMSQELEEGIEFIADSPKQDDFRRNFKSSINRNNLKKSYTENANEEVKSKIIKTALTSSQYDRQNDFIPQPGSSKVIDCNSKFDENNISCTNNSISLLDNTGIVSFYDDRDLCSNETLNNSLSANKHTNLVDILNRTDFDLYRDNKSVTKSDLKLWFSDNTCTKLSENNSNDIPNNPRKVILRPLLMPPSRNDIASSMEEYNISLHRAKMPFYSSHKDVGAQIEIGHIILKLKCNNLSNIKEFPTTLSNNNLSSWREKIFINSNNTQITDLNIKDLDLILASNRKCVLMPVIQPPTSESVKLWLDSKKIIANKNIQDVKTKKCINKQKIFLHNSSGEETDSDGQIDSIILSPYSDDNVSIEEDRKNILKMKDEGEFLDTTLKENVYNECIKKSNNSSQKSDGSLPCGQIYKENLSQIEEENVTRDNVSDTYMKFESTSAGLDSIRNIYKYSGDNYYDAPVHHENDFLTILVMEVHTLTRGDLYPDPQIDPICAVFYSVYNDYPEGHAILQNENGFIYVHPDMTHNKVDFCPEMTFQNYNITKVSTEKKLFDEVVNLVLKWDPDILCGFEVDLSSWGYLIQRGYVLDINLKYKISRVIENNQTVKNDFQETDKEINLIGRIVLNVWRLLRHEVALTSYTFENLYYHIFHERIPYFSYKTLTFWWSHPLMFLRPLCVEYYMTRTINTIRMLLQLDLIGRTSELARLFGIQWYEVLSRGSQFRVESMMIRLTRYHNYVLVSPSVQQRAAMKAPECLPLILEPESRFYGDPVIVLDFQSLYPSMIIAYNYCYSTCIGKVENMGKNTPFPFGASLLRISPRLLQKLHEKDLINWSPCGAGFVKSSVRKGILPKMLEDILNTRFMVKKAMKRHKKNKTLQKILHNRQLGLKLIANVTYGYTAANFSGRMPCVEVGDSVVSKGRETLERAIRFIENTSRWKAKVVYGDTDSLFVLVPGRSRSEAFDIGAEIAEAITNDNPTPVKLKLEKVYQPCILQTKKRYVGYMYESKDQESPDYDAKGIETVRRDGCPATAKILEKSLKILFETYDVSKVKSYICHKFQNIVEGKCNLQDFIFAREFRGMNAYKARASIPALEIAKRYKQVDHRREPREGQRVPYVIVNGAPGQTLLQSTRCPREVLEDSSLRLNHNYYITKVIIPPLNRCFTLIGADVNLWFSEISRKQTQPYPILKNEQRQAENKKSTISQYFTKINCVGCDEQTIGGVCEKCISTPQKTMLTIYGKMNKWERRHMALRKICQSCCGRSTEIDCASIDCPNLFNLNLAVRDLEQVPFMLQMEKKMLEF